MRLTPQQVRDAAALLQELLPRARLLDVPSFKATSALGKSGIQHFTAHNLRGVHVYPAPLGGWHGDVMFDVPPAYPDVLGTPAQAPCRTREAAIDAALGILASVLNAPGDAPALPPVAVFHGFSINLAPDILAILRAKGCEGYGSAAAARQRLDEIAAELFPDDAVDPTRLSKDDATRLVSVLHMASFDDVLVHPPHPDRSPSGHGPGGSAH